MGQGLLSPGDSVRLITKPTGQATQHLPLTIGNIYKILYFDGSNVVTTTDEPEQSGSYWRGRVEKVE